MHLVFLWLILNYLIMAVTLTVDNFVHEIKKMDPRARGKLRSEELINLIVQVPDRNEQSPQIDEIMRIVTDLQNSVIGNSQEILKIKVENQVLRDEKIAMATQIDTLLEDTSILKSQVEGLEQYNRVNNIEIVGLEKKPLPPGTEDETDEEMVLACLNGMVDEERENDGDGEEEDKFTSADIDICHILPKHNIEHSHVVRFVSRKAKMYALSLKKANMNRNYKFRTKTIYINEHLTTNSKTLFSLAKQKTKALNYKHLWTRNGKIFVRKTDVSDVIKIDSEEKIAGLL